MEKDTRLVGCRVPAAMHQWLKDEAARQDRSLNWTLLKLLNDAKARAEAKPQEGAQ